MRRQASLRLLGLALFVGLAAAAAAAASGESAASGRELPTLLELFQTSPWINGAIGVLSVLALGLFLYFLATVHTRAMVPADLINDVTKLVVSEQYDEAARVCRDQRGIFVASILQRCVENTGKGHSVIMNMIDAEGRRRADIVWNRTSYLADISNVAPMLGLLGTVFGMIQAFFGLELGPAGGPAAGALSRGIAGAMATTLFGLAVGIMALVFYSIVKARVTRILAEAEQAVHTVADHIKRGQA